MRLSSGFGEKFNSYMAVLFPLLVTQVGLFAMNLIDTLMIGRVGAADLAGAAIGSSIWVVLDAIDGVLLAIVPLVSQLIGAKEEHKVAETVYQGLYIAAGSALLFIVAGFFLLDPFLQMMNLEPIVAQKAKYYLIALGFGLLPLHIFIVCFHFMNALGRTVYAMLLMLLSLPVNVLLNYMLIFGKFGLPKLGVAGAGISTSLSYWLLMVLALIVMKKVYPFSSYNILDKLQPFSWKITKTVIILGLPIGFSMMVDTGIDTMITLLMGAAFDMYTLAAHQIVVNIRVLFFMVPLSISMATTSLVGYSIGAGKLKDATDYVLVSFLISGGFILFSAGILYFFDDSILRSYTNDRAIIGLGKNFLLIAVLVLVLESIKLPIQGALRGAKDVRWSLAVDVVGYWVVGLSAGYYLTQFTFISTYGYWAGLAVGLAFIVAGQSVRWILVRRKLTSSFTAESEKPGI